MTSQEGSTSLREDHLAAYSQPQLSFSHHTSHRAMSLLATPIYNPAYPSRPPEVVCRPNTSNKDLRWSVEEGGLHRSIPEWLPDRNALGFCRRVDTNQRA